LRLCGTAEQAAEKAALPRLCRRLKPTPEGIEGFIGTTEVVP